MISHTAFDVIENKSLLGDKSFIDGSWISSESTFPVINPFNQKTIAEISCHGKKETEASINAANKAFLSWKKVSPQEKSNLLREWHRLIVENADDIAKIMTIEQGKPLTDSEIEINYGVSFIEWFAEEAKRIHGDVYPANNTADKYVGIKEPVGVVAAITPWNFPFAMITRKISPAIAAGCTIILKPAEDTPLTAIALVKLAEQAGFPKGVINLIIGNAVEIGTELTANNLVKKLSFTGSTPVGKLLYKQSADTLKKLSLELGGNAPFIVFDDAKLDITVKGLVAGKARNTGQACTSINRVYIHEDKYEEFIPLLLQEFKKLNIGNGLEKTTNQGPLINKAAIDKVTKLINDAQKNGARIIYQAENNYGGLFYPPTIIEVSKENLEIEKEEIFGPVIAIYKFSCSDEEIIHRANNTNYGLAAYFYTESRKRVWNIADSLDYGMIGINETAISNAYIPFGGVKHSGFGKEGSIYGMDDYLNIKYYSFGNN